MRLGLRHRLGNMQGAAANRFLGPLDLYPGAAFGMARVVLSATFLKSPLERCRRDNDDDEVDVLPDLTASYPQITLNSPLVGSSATYGDFLGANNGFARWVADQSGNARHLQQATAASQPKIVSGGSLVTGGIDFDGTQSLVSSTMAIVTVFQIVKFDATDTVYNSASTRVLSNAGVSYDNQGDFFRIRLFGPLGSVSTSSPGPTTTKSLITSRHVDGNFATWKNGSAGSTSASTIGYVAESTQPLSVGAKTGLSGGVDFDGQYECLIVYPTDQSSNRAVIEANLAEIYGSTLA